MLLRDDDYAGLLPVLRWAGSKKRSLPHLLRVLPEIHGRYVEVFAGSACLFFALAPKRAVISDSNVDLMHFYKTIAQRGDDVFAKFKSIRRTESSYYSIRSRNFGELDDVTRSAYFLYLNRNCFNGIYRTNNKGQFNVPFSNSRVQKYPSLTDFRKSATALGAAKLRCADFERICLDEVRRDDFVYLDPPYYIPKKRVFREYSSVPFSEKDVVRLANVLREIDRRRAKFLLSYPECRLINQLAKDWQISRIKVHRTIAGNTSSRGYTPEVLVCNFDVVRQLN
jgi:DNA adenine methylase